MITAARPPFLSKLSVEAEAFIQLCGEELRWTDGQTAERWSAVRAEIASTGAWTPEFVELEHGARVAWRNNARCIGRLFWPGLQVRDRREVRDGDEVYAALRDHLRGATNGGRVQSWATLFAPAIDGRAPVRIWNHQLLGYAGYRGADGVVVGDPKNVAFTEAVMRLGWRGEGGAFDLLPIVIETASAGPRWYPPLRAEALEVPIRHPEVAAIAELGLRWYAVPVLSDLALDVGGLRFPAVPFNGWYMGTEIGARNFADGDRYDMLPRVADALGLDRSRDRTLWKDRALVELNVAVLWSYEQAGVRIVDHHRASSEFMEFARREMAAGRAVSADGTWIVPPISGAATPVFHRRWTEREATPNYVAQPPAWA